MGQPTMSDVHVNALLTNLSLMYAQEADAFVAQRVFPVIPVNNRSDRYTIFSRADFNRNTMRKRAPGTESAGSGYKVDTTPTYSCDVWALHHDIDDQTRANADSVFNLDSDATKFLVNQALISREKDWASTFFAGSVWTTTRTGVVSAPSSVQVIQWSDYPNSTPIQDIRRTAQAVQLANGGRRPNKLVLGRPVFDVLCDHPDFIDRIKYGQTPGRPAKVTLEGMAQIFELDEVLVMDAIENTGTETQALLNGLETNAFIGSKSALLVYTPVSPGLQVPASGYTFAWTGYFGAAANGTRIKSFYIPEIESTRVEIDAAYDHKCVGPEMGAWMPTIVA